MGPDSGRSLQHYLICMIAVELGSVEHIPSSSGKLWMLHIISQLFQTISSLKCRFSSIQSNDPYLSTNDHLIYISVTHDQLHPYNHQFDMDNLQRLWWESHSKQLNHIIKIELED